ncbi:MAG: SoxR reducing system RseC family protein [Ignavibacterium sp.]|jgi:sigma-E factor negative regulatory protein RseC|nr:SoxR reducing system RseC family protein [Ignavibacterium sp.]
MTKERKMYREELYEDGIVKEASDGIAEIVISDSDHCEECSAKVYCKPGSSNERSLTVKDPFGVQPGDKVRVTIKGSKILSASFLLYGIPLIILVVGIFIGLQIFTINKELFSTLLALGFISIYSLGLFLYAKQNRHKVSSHPEITFVSHPQN